MPDADEPNGDEPTASVQPFTRSSAGAPSLMRLREVSKTYHMGDVSVPVLHHINLEIRRGELLVVVGPSGSGKSTLLNIVGGIDTPTSGEVWFGERDLAKLSGEELTRHRRLKVGFVFQFYNLVPTLTAVENVLVAAELTDKPMSPTDALDLVGLEHRRDHFPSQLSGGEQQRVAIARAISTHPQLLLCDEPTGALDLATGRMILGVLADLNRDLGTPVGIITHHAAIARIADRIVRIGSGTIADIRENPRKQTSAEISW